jgi:hypothetical protein
LMALDVLGTAECGVGGEREGGREKGVRGEGTLVEGEREREREREREGDGLACAKLLPPALKLVMTSRKDKKGPLGSRRWHFYLFFNKTPAGVCRV